MPLKNDREYRSLLENVEAKQEENEYIVEGYATTFNERYTLYGDDEYRVDEQISPNAFNNCDMSDVIFQYNHEGRVFARTRNNTLQLLADEHGLKMRANLGGTEAGRQLWEEIHGGYTDKMSFGFVVDSDERAKMLEGEQQVIVRTITGIKKLYDVSAVSFPANDGTEISARSYCDGVIAEAKEQERLASIEKENREKKMQEIRRLLNMED